MTDRPSAWVARHFRTGERIRVEVSGERISRIEPAGEPRPDDPWIAPGFLDIQMNGRWGWSFSDPDTDADRVEKIIRAQAPLGTTRVCPTLITASPEAMRRGVAAIAEACGRSPDVAAMVPGIHLEGPFLSPLDGFRGAHPIEAIRDPDWDEFRRLQDASGDRIRLMTLAPERPGAIEFIRRATGSGVVIAIGHSSADAGCIAEAVEAGATLSTHLGNGLATPLPRHPNPIWDQAAHDGLSASLIADGHHLDPSTLRVLIRAKPPDRVILVSDASPLAGLPPGRYGNWVVEPSGKVVVAGTPYLAGANRDLIDGLNRVLDTVSLPEAIDMVGRNPCRLLGLDEPRMEPGGRADFVLLGQDVRRGPSLVLLGTCLGGIWMGPEAM